MSILAEAKAARRQPPSGFTDYYLDAHDGVQLRVALALLEGPSKGTVVFVPGRTEFIEKFFEDMHVWQKLGYSVAALDLRGQGLSHRYLKDREKHYVRSFDDHPKDIKALFDHLDEVGAPAPRLIMAHSAGGHCTLRFLAEFPGSVERAIMTAPMVDVVPDGGFARLAAQSLVNSLSALGLKGMYLPGYGKYKPGKFGWRQLLTNDPDRFEDEDYFISRNRNLALGGVTIGWLRAATQSIAKLHSPGYPEQIDVPVLIFKASEEAIVSNRAMCFLVNRLAKGRLRGLRGAKHEILKETDSVRLTLWQLVADHMGFDPAVL